MVTFERNGSLSGCCLMRYLFVTISIVGAFLCYSRMASAEMRLYRGDLEILSTSGNGCIGLRGKQDIALIFAVDEENDIVSGYFGGNSVTTGRFGGNRAAMMSVSYPFQDPQRAEGHRIKLEIVDQSLTGELRDRRIEATENDCNYTLARISASRVEGIDAAMTVYNYMHGRFEAQLSRSRALSLTRKGLYSDAVPLLESSLSLAESTYGVPSPELAPYLLSLANAYIRLGKYEEFNRLYQERQAAITDEASRSIFNAHRVLALVKIGRASMAREDYTSALESFLSAGEIDYKNKDVIAGVMSAYVRSGHHEEAIRFLAGTEQRLDNEADRHDVNDATALVYYQKAKRDEKAGKQAEAEESLHQAVRLDPDTAQYLIQLARWRHKSGSYRDADELLRKRLDSAKDDQMRQEIISARLKMRQTEDILKRLHSQGG